MPVKKRRMTIIVMGLRSESRVSVRLSAGRA